LYILLQIFYWLKKERSTESVQAIDKLQKKKNQEAEWL
jgi:hypothetical protein